MIASSEFAEIMGPHEVILTSSAKADELLRPFVPSFADMHDELKRSVPGVEFVPKNPAALRSIRGCWLAVDSDRVWHRQKAYAKMYIDHDAVEAKDGERIRQTCLQACRLLGGVIAKQVEETWWPEIPAGASVTYATALVQPPQRKMAVRWIGEQLPTWIKRWSDDSDLGVLVDAYSDRYVLRLVAYYFVTPVGEEYLGE